MSKEKKYVVVYIRSKYCTYCLMQEAQIKKNQRLKQKLDSSFYFVKGLAENDSVIVFNHKKYTNPKPEKPYQVNDFINVYGKNEKGFVAYPLWLYFDRDYRLILRFYGLMPPENILKVLDEIEKADTPNNDQYHE
ncbi:MAG: thioredoxin family protein [Flavobacteriaceae bacterium]|nr:thioredoxin family protein [Flavobacteriaceae bacterium]